MSDHFDYGRMIRFTLPSVVMMLFTSIYGIVDGFFVSNFVGKTEFAALNLIWPLPMFLGSVGFMLGSGGTALVAKTMGEGNRHRAHGYFSMVMYFAIALGVLLGIVGTLLVKPVAILLGAEGELLHHAVIYGRIITAFMPAYVMQCMMEPFFVAAERPKLGLLVNIAAGVTNMVLDVLLVGVLKWGLPGAAAATVMAEIVCAGWGLTYFSLPDRRKTTGNQDIPERLFENRSLLRLGRPLKDLHALGRACVNGLSELVTNIALSFVNMIYVAILLKMSGENGVSAYGIIMYTAMIFLAVFFGFNVGIAPVVGFHYGAQNHDELHNLRTRSMKLQSVTALVMTGLAIGFARPLAGIFVGYDQQLWDLTTRAFTLYSLSFLLAHINIFASAFFTALNDGITSGIISFSRMLAFQLTALLVLPKIIGLDGVWLAMLFAEIGSSAVTIALLKKNQKKFRY